MEFSKIISVFDGNVKFLSSFCLLKLEDFRSWSAIDCIGQTNCFAASHGCIVALKDSDLEFNAQTASGK
jgi:hypothetical protein